MKEYSLDFTKKSLDDITFLKKTGNKTLLIKLFQLLKEIKTNPYRGTGKPEPLKFQLAGKWSRRINKEHRIIYEVKENTIIIHSLSGHY